MYEVYPVFWGMLLESTHLATVATDGDIQEKNDKWLGLKLESGISCFSFGLYACLIPGLRHSNAIKGLDTPWLATLRATVAEAESNSTFGTLCATNCIVWHPPKKFCCVQLSNIFVVCTVCSSLRPSCGPHHYLFSFNKIITSRSTRRCIWTWLGHATNSFMTFPDLLLFRVMVSWEMKSFLCFISFNAFKWMANCEDIFLSLMFSRSFMSATFGSYPLFHNVSINCV